MFNNSIGNSIIRITPAAKKPPFAAKSRFVYWNEISLTIYLIEINDEIIKK